MNRDSTPWPLQIPGVASPPRLRLHSPDDILSRTLAKHGVWEPFETTVFLSLLRRGDCVVDVGANLGYYTVLAAEAVGPDGIVHAIEPDPENVALLRENIALNALSNVMVHAFAAADGTGRAALHQDLANRGDHRLYASRNEPRLTVPVGTTSLDALLAVQHGIRLIKIDAQGSELAIFRGMSKLLARRTPDLCIITEVWPYGLREAGGSVEALLAMLAQYGFRAQLIDEPEQRLVPVTYDGLAETLRSSWYAEHQGFVNLLLA